MDNELHKISKSVQEMADFIKDCDNKGAVPIIVRSRSCGKIAAYRLARQTEDVEHEIIQQKQIEVKYPCIICKKLLCRMSAECCDSCMLPKK